MYIFQISAQAYARIKDATPLNWIAETSPNPTPLPKRSLNPRAF